jgi:tRNA(fMet)-specific endonuclease VapC
MLSFVFSRKSPDSSGSDPNCSALERVGKPIGGMDLMIAAHALAEDSVLITNNTREFHRVPGLAVEEWAMD